MLNTDSVRRVVSSPEGLLSNQPMSWRRMDLKNARRILKIWRSQAVIQPDTCKRKWGTDKHITNITGKHYNSSLHNISYANTVNTKAAINANINLSDVGGSIRIHQNNLYATVFIKIVVNGSLETSDSSLLLSPPGNQGLESEYNFQMSFGLGKRRWMCSNVVVIQYSTFTNNISTIVEILNTAQYGKKQLFKRRTLLSALQKEQPFP